jgi:hypothetical protein
MSRTSQPNTAMNTQAVQPLGRSNRVLTRLALTTLFFACAVCVGLALLVILFKLGVFHNIDVYFYRGVVLVGIAGILTFVLFVYVARWFRADMSAALTAAVLSMSINLSFLVIFPVTIDRSISVFLLGYMNQHPEEAFTPSQLRNAFSNIYVGQYQQIERRMDEQLVSRNINQVGEAYQISAQGRAFVSFARAIAWMFDTDPRFVSGGAKAGK